MKCCPTCGQPLVGAVEQAISGLRLSTFQRRVVMGLARRMGQWVLAAELLDAVYFDDADGGPDKAQNCLSVYVWQARPKLRKVGLEIEGIPGRGGRRRLVWASERRASEAA